MNYQLVCAFFDGFNKKISGKMLKYLLFIISGIMKIGGLIISTIALFFLILMIHFPIISWLNSEIIGIARLSYLSESIVRALIFTITIALSLYLLSSFSRRIGINFKDISGKLSSREKNIIFKVLILELVLTISFVGIILITGGTISDKIPNFSDNPLIFILRVSTAVVSQPLLEELLFRGIIQEKLTNYSKWGSIIMTSILFSWTHGLGSIFNYQFVSSIIYGTTYYKTKNIKSSTILHSFHNLLIIICILYFT